jgi:hypothetical protein
MLISSKIQGLPTNTVLCAYLGFIAIAVFIFHAVAEQETSSVLTLSALAQCLGITFLCIQSLSSGSAVGISAVSLLLDAIAIVFRLCSTLFVDGYLPSDKSGDFIYQVFDVCSLLMLVFLMRRVLVNHVDTYQVFDDTVRAGPLVIICFGLAAVLHGDMDDSVILDTFWLAGLFISVVAVVPQLWLIVHSGGWTGALISHYIAAMALSRVLSGCFMWMARHHITCTPYVTGVQHTLISIFIAHVLHIVLLGDFAYHYLRSMLKGGMCLPMHLAVEV